MALLQISEPGESPAPHQHRLAVGIDLGTTNSLVATVRNGIAVVLPDENGQPLLPSIVRYGRDGVEVGYRGAGEAGDATRTNTIVSVKRFMGRGLADVADDRRFPVRFRRRAGHGAARDPRRRQEPGRGLGAKSCARCASAPRRAWAAISSARSSRSPPTSTTRSARRPRTRRGSPGSNVLRLLNEPTAAAIAYGLDNAAEGIYAVYDLGGGTFDISILRLSRGVFEVLATNGDSALGGDDFDHRVYCWVVEEARLPPLSPEDTRLLLVKAREAKEHLTHPRAARDHRDAVRPASRSTLTLTAETFAEITQNLVAKTLGAGAKALRDAGLQVDDVKGVVMVGGATRMPQIQQAVAEFFGAGAAQQSRSGQGRRAGRGDPGQRARRQPRRGRRLAAARRDPALARPRDDGRPGREDRPAQLDHPGVARAGIHHLQGRADRDGDPRGAGRARAGQRLPLARALRIARHSADGGRRGAHPRHVPGGRRRPAVGVGARATSGVEAPSRSSLRTACRDERHRAHAAGFVRACRRGHGGARARRSAVEATAHARRPSRRSTSTPTCSADERAADRRARSLRSPRCRARHGPARDHGGARRRSTRDRRSSPRAAWTAASAARSPGGGSTT